MAKFLKALGIFAVYICAVIGMIFLLELGKAAFGMSFVGVVLIACLMSMFYIIYSQIK